MSFREKILWTTLIAGIGPYLWYFGTVAAALLSGEGEASLSLSRLVTAMLLGLVVMIIAVVTVAIRNKNEGTMIPDERERVAEARGFTVSYHLLCTGVIITIGGAWWGWSHLVVLNLLAFAFIAAELTRVAIEIVGLRRGWHG